MTVSELLARTSSAEITEWIAYEQMTGPLGSERDDLLMAVLAAVTANSNRGKGRKARPQDFLPSWDQTKKQPMGWPDMLAAVKRLNTSLGGTDLTEGGGNDGSPRRTPRPPRHRHR